MDAPTGHPPMPGAIGITDIGGEPLDGTVIDMDTDIGTSRHVETLPTDVASRRLVVARPRVSLHSASATSFVSTLRAIGTSNIITLTIKL